MKHPELAYLASHRCHMSLMQVIYGAFDRRRVYVSARTLSMIYDNLVRDGVLPDLVEDHALSLLADEERRQKQLRLPNSFEEWTKRT